MQHPIEQAGEVQGASAAPDLFEALEAVLERFDPLATPGTNDNLAVVQRALAALAKARGEVA